MVNKRTINTQKLICIDLVKIYRKNIEDYSIIGYPLIYNKDIVLLNYAYDIMLDGYKLIKTNDITNIEQNSENVKFLSNIYRSENITPVFPQGFENVETLRDVIKILKEKETVCIIENETKEDSFGIGRVTSLSNDVVSLLGFDSKCIVDDGVTAFRIPDITTVSFGGRYTEIMGKYVDWGHKKQKQIGKNTTEPSPCVTEPSPCV